MGASICFDLIADIPGSNKKKCTTRKCRDSYVCDCGGESYCEHATEEHEALVPTGKNECAIAKKQVTNVFLRAVNLSDVHSTVPGKSSNCFFSDTECTCASTADIGITQDCLDFLYEDPIKGSICRMRDCKESMQCDCDGSRRCTRAMRKHKVWRKMGNEGRPGLAICEKLESNAYQIKEKKSAVQPKVETAPPIVPVEEQPKEEIPGNEM